MAEAKKTEAKAPKEKKEKEKKVAGFATSAVITLGESDELDKEGKPTGSKVKYGAKNNPKRGASAERFAKYKDGMTIQKALDAGLTGADIAHDLKKKFISIKAAA